MQSGDTGDSFSGGMGNTFPLWACMKMWGTLDTKDFVELLRCGFRATDCCAVGSEPPIGGAISCNCGLGVAAAGKHALGGRSGLADCHARPRGWGRGEVDQAVDASWRVARAGA